MPCPNCKDDRVSHFNSSKEMKEKGYTEWYLGIDENANPDLMYCPYCGWALEPKIQPKCSACTREQLCLHCLNSGFWVDEDKCPSCAANGHTSPWQVSKCEQCNEDYYDSTYKGKDSFANRCPSSEYVCRKVIKALKEGEASSNDIQIRIANVGIKLHIDDIRSALCKLLDDQLIRFNLNRRYELATHSI